MLSRPAVWFIHEKTYFQHDSLLFRLDFFLSLQLGDQKIGAAL
jgi:hypothetical protein